MRDAQMMAKQPDEPHALSSVTENPSLQTEDTRLPEPVTAPVASTASSSDVALAHNMPDTAFSDSVPLVQQTALLQTLFDTRPIHVHSVKVSLP